MDPTLSLMLQIAVNKKDETPFLLVLIFCTRRWWEAADKQIKKSKCQEVMHVAHFSALMGWQAHFFHLGKAFPVYAMT